VRAQLRAHIDHAYEGLIAQADQQIAWAQRGMKLVDEPERDGDER
jgi:hypothetical protein